MTDLEKLIEAAESGAWLHGIAPEPYQASCEEAFLGSLEDAMWCMNIVPGWRWSVRQCIDGKSYRATLYDDRDEGYDYWPSAPVEATSSMPARAWIVAILKAYRANGGAK